MAMTNIKEFQERLTKFCEEDVPMQFKRRQIEVIVFMVFRLQEYTPIAPDDSQWKGFRGGNALANWRVSMGSIPSGTIPAYGKPGRKLTEQRLRAQLTTLAQGTSAGRGAGGRFANIPGSGIADTVWIFNNVHYIQSLEDGNTRDPSKGYMVKLTLDETVDFIKTRGWWD